MSRQYDEYLEDIGYFDIQEEDTEWVELSSGGGRRKELYLSNKGILAGPRYFDEEHTDGEMWPVTAHKGDKHGHPNARWVDDDGFHHEEYIHRLVAENFIPNDDPEHKKCVLHWDDDPRNNRVENLRWGTMKENHEDSVRNGNHKGITDEARMIGIEKTRVPVVATNIDTGESIHFYSIAEAVRQLGVQESNLCKVLRGERKHTMRWYFERESKDN